MSRHRSEVPVRKRMSAARAAVLMTKATSADARRPAIQTHPDEPFQPKKSKIASITPVDAGECGADQQREAEHRRREEVARFQQHVVAGVERQPEDVAHGAAGERDEADRGPQRDDEGDGTGDGQTLPDR
jgi:hypothetical protein